MIPASLSSQQNILPEHCGISGYTPYSWPARHCDSMALWSVVEKRDDESRMFYYHMFLRRPPSVMTDHRWCILVVGCLLQTSAAAASLVVEETNAGMAVSVAKVTFVCGLLFVEIAALVFILESTTTTDVWKNHHMDKNVMHFLLNYKKPPMTMDRAAPMISFSVSLIQLHTSLVM